MSRLRLDTGGGNVLDCVTVIGELVAKFGDEIDELCWHHVKACTSPSIEEVGKAIARVNQNGSDHDWWKFYFDAGAAIAAITKVTSRDN